jgi:hypothetical protein
MIRISQITNRLLTATRKFFKKKPANLVLSVSIFLTIFSLAILLEMIFDDFRRHISLTDAYGKENGTNDVDMAGYENLCRMTRSYIVWQSLNAWLIGLRILFDFGFSRELSLVLELINEAILDILFFVLMFFLVFHYIKP